MRKSLLLRLDPGVHEALAKWAADDLRSLNGQLEWLLREALERAGRLKGHGGEPGKSRGAPPQPRKDAD